ncbi:MAG: protein kinase, partial [Flavobacteriaceae bacterium]|nr:protein kinase [Flavobacteriaceae bacterium]
NRDNCPYSHTIDGIDAFIALCKESDSFVADPSDEDFSDDDSDGRNSDSGASDDSISEDGKDYPQLRFPGRDGEGHDVAGDVLYGRFAVICKLGKGVFSKVVLAHDTVTASVVALKVFRGSETYCQAADDEMRIYSKLQANSGGNDYCFLRALAYVGAPNPHHAIVFPVGGLSLFEIIKTNTRVFREMVRSGKISVNAKDRSQKVLAGAKICGFPLETVRSFLFQLLRFVCYAHSQGIVLTDLKPENIILSSSIPLMRTSNGVSVPPHTGITVIDMGNAVELLENGYAPERQDAQTRHYRAPEVVLNCAYSLPVDVWSVGILIPELLTGVAPFMTHDNVE